MSADKDRAGARVDSRSAVASSEIGTDALLPSQPGNAARCHLRRFGFLWRLHRWEEAGWGCERCKDCGAMR